MFSTYRRTTQAAITFAAIMVCDLALITPAYALHPMALWLVVHDLCAQDMRLTGNPAPCTALDPQAGIAVVKDLKDPTQLLLVPTARITGIESPDLLKPETRNYWQDAWTARTFLDKRARQPVPREDVALAVNSIAGRSQDQLHIHIDCVRRDVRDALKEAQNKISDRWSAVVLPLGRSYAVRSVVGENLGTNDPFKLLASSHPEAAAAMGDQTLVTVGAVLPGNVPGFYVLARQADIFQGDAGHGEELLDHGCGVLQPTSTPAQAELRPRPPA